jgi:hypothetical protein
MPTRTHALGGGAYGRIIEYDDGTAAYKRPMEFSHVFRVGIADVTGFSVERGKKFLQRRLLILGNGTTLAAADVGHGVAEQVEAWFRAHKKFGGNRGASAKAPVHTTAPAPVSVADELAKLADLKNQGILTQAEFDAQKDKLLAR